jgi:hypothetical protein
VPPETIAETFTALAARWQRATADSSLSEIDAHPARAELKALGQPCLPLILAELERKPWVGWFPLLAELTGVDRAEGADSVQGAAERWLAWGRQQAVG